ncbi:DUF6243 family protein [Actinomadura sediminis]|uniref:DUF6243 family protein n=1 Tax=Actinomadura sediminis TaxID=1038904 RepID=A0ABW3ENN2_9ACTN
MAKKGRNGLLGVGGQRNNVSRRRLRGETARTSGDRNDAAAAKRELLEKMRERNERPAAENEK